MCWKVTWILVLIDIVASCIWCWMHTYDANLLLHHIAKVLSWSSDCRDSGVQWIETCQTRQYKVFPIPYFSILMTLHVPWHPVFGWQEGHQLKFNPSKPTAWNTQTIPITTPRSTSLKSHFLHSDAQFEFQQVVFTSRCMQLLPYVWVISLLC